MATAEEEKGKKSPLRSAGIASALLAVCLAAAAGGMAVSMGPAAFLALLGGGEAEAAETASEGAAESAEDTKGPGGGSDAAGGAEMTMLPLDEMIVNITALTLNGRRTSRFLKLNAAVLYDPSVEGADEIEARQLYLRDSFQDYLRQLNESDLEGSAGLARLKAELLRRARAVTDSEAPREILVADMVIQ